MDRKAINIGGSLSGITVITKNRRYCWVDQRFLRLDIVTIGRDVATVTLVYKVRGQNMIGRQMQTWVRFPDVGWKIVAAHVSMIDREPTL
jgi:hypothetical protein